MTKTANTMGCKTSTPFFWAMAPTANGNTAAPPPPNAAAKPMVLTWRSLGRTLVATITAAGNSGPRKKPSRMMKTTAAAK